MLYYIKYYLTKKQSALFKVDFTSMTLPRVNTHRTGSAHNSKTKIMEKQFGLTNFSIFNLPVSTVESREEF